MQSTTLPLPYMSVSLVGFEGEASQLELPVCSQSTVTSKNARKITKLTNNANRNTGTITWLLLILGFFGVQKEKPTAWNVVELESQRRKICGRLAEQLLAAQTGGFF